MKSRRVISIGIISEGVTDQIILKALVEKIFKDGWTNFNIDYTLDSIQPTYDQLDNRWSPGGWGNIYHWCKNKASQFGSLREDPNCAKFDILIIQIDADVAFKRYSDYADIEIDENDLPLPCPTSCPSSIPCMMLPCHGVAYIQKLLLSWCNETTLPSNIITCIPSKSLEAWIIASIPRIPPFFNTLSNKTVQRIWSNIECKDNPERFAFREMKTRERLAKTEECYKRYQPVFVENWNRVMEACNMARIFHDEFCGKIARV